VRGHPAALNGSAYILYNLTPHLSATAGISQGFRAPNVDDSAILGGVGSRFEIPNSSLQPERSVNLEAGVRATGRLGNASLVVFDDRYRDLIERAPALLGDLPFVDLNGNSIMDAKEQAVFQRQNINRARVQGFEFETMLNLWEGWTWTHTTTWTRGTDPDLAQPLSRMPPLNGVSRVTWQTRGPVWVEAALVAASSQRRLSPSDRSDVRIGPNGTAGYAVIYLRAGLRRSPLAGLSIAWENVTNRRYRLHGSGFDGPGSSLVIGYSRSFR
jgi:outer membrane receptor protein involved in Fe transport